jgi:hypothetical protein
VIFAFHDSLVAGHGGIERTMTKVSRSANFKQMKSRIVDYVRTCSVCQRVKPDDRKPPGLIQSSPIGAPWDTLYIFLHGAYTFVLVVIDGWKSSGWKSAH